MGTGIEWADETWNPITGCSLASYGCNNCYAMRLAGGRMRHHPSRAGLTQPTSAGPVWTGEVRFNEEWLDQPKRWTRPRRIFVCAHSDLFHDRVPREWIARIFGVMASARTRHHTFLVLTKRPERARTFLTGPLGGALPNVWLGVSAEDQRWADERIPVLLATPAAVRWLSAEPLLNRINLRRLNLGDGLFVDAMTGFHTGSFLEGFRGGPLPKATGRLDWLIVGGESGPRARPMHPEWARFLRDQTAIVPCAFFFKQHGEFVSVSEVEGPGEHYTFPDGTTVRRTGKKRAGRTLDGREWQEMPA